MLKQALDKDIYKELTKSRSRFLSILLMIALGAFVFEGLWVTGSTMRNTLLTFTDTYNLGDMTVSSPIGIDEKDRKILSLLPGVEGITYTYRADQMIRGAGYVVRLESAAAFPQYEVVEGRLPAAANEVSMDALMMKKGYRVGDKISFVREKNEDDRSLKRYIFEIVGFVNSPEYLLPTQKGVSSAGDGVLDFFGVISEENFDMENYSLARLNFTDVQGMDAGSDEYKERMEAHVSRVENLFDLRPEERRREIQEEGAGDIAEAEEEITDAEKELADAKTELTDARKELDEGWADYRKGKIDFAIEIADAEQEIIDGEKELADAYEELLDGYLKYYEGEQELADAKQKLLDGEKELADAKEELDKAEKEIASGAKKLRQGRAKLEENKAAWQAGMDQIDDGLSQISTALQGIEIAMSQEGADLAVLQAQKEQLEMQQSGLLAQKQTLQDQKVLLDNAEVKLDSGRRKLSAGRAEYNEGKAEYEDALEELENARKEIADGEIDLADAEIELLDGQKEYDDGVIELTDAKETLAEEKAKGEKELRDAYRELIDGEADYKEGLEEYESELPDALEEIAEAKGDVRKARRDLAVLKIPDYTVHDRYKDMGFYQYMENSESMDLLSMVFPVFFFLIALLVSLTTMTRMVDEQRLQIGTLKALGYSNGSIIKKFLVYGSTASLIGSVAGIIAGQKILMPVVFQAYSSNFLFHESIPEYSPLFSVTAVTISLFCTGFVALLTTKASLKDNAATLLRPKTPKDGNRILLERFTPLWQRLSFNSKVTARNIFRYKKRMLMTILGVAGCAALIFMGFAIRDSVTGILDKQYGELFHYDTIVIYDEDADAAELEEYRQNLASDSRISETFPAKYEQGLVRIPGKPDQHINIIVPENPESFSTINRLQDRRTKEPLPLDNGAVISEKIATILHIGVGGEISFKDGDGEEQIITISGITENYSGHYLYLSSVYYEEVWGEKYLPNCDFILLNDHGDKSVSDFSTSILNKDVVLNTLNTSISVDAITELVNSLNIVVFVIILASSMLAVVVLYNLTNINVSERIRELSTIMVLGFYPKEVTAYVYRETSLLTMIGIILGYGLGLLLHGIIVFALPPTNVMMDPAVKAATYVYATGFTFAFSIVVMLIMHKRLKGIDMVEALKAVE